VYNLLILFVLPSTNKGRNRWVIYADKYGMDYDGSQVDPKWHTWLHYQTDVPPTIQPPKINKFVIAPIENKTGTSAQYVPYSTMKPKIESWVPPQHNAQK
jgi:NADH dehydrogenase (ubiquinone) 1 alpha subcomplex subunit 12